MEQQFAIPTDENKQNVILSISPDVEYLSVVDGQVGTTRTDDMISNPLTDSEGNEVNIEGAQIGWWDEDCIALLDDSDTLTDNEGQVYYRITGFIGTRPTTRRP